jgi:molybdopterin-guanine dinucleotide biosynthesis protein A
MNPTCLIGITGYSGSGKTTLIRRILPELKKQGLSVGVLKHIHHKLELDVRGKDTDYFYRAGADFVFAYDAQQGFARYRNHDEPLSDLMGRLPAALDLIIIEGHKDIDVPGIWLEARTNGKKVNTIGYGNRRIVFRDEPRYHQKVLAYIREELEKFHSKRLLMAGLLIGGKSMRMGAPKTLLKLKGKTLAERSFDVLASVSRKTMLLGSGPLPDSLNTADRLPDFCGLEGPIAGFLSAFRWAPEVTWMLSSVDMPFMQKEAWEWLLSQRRPGVWAILPKIKGSRGVETTGAVYEPMIFEYIESLSSEGIATLQAVAEHPKVITPLIPKPIEYCWMNVNTPAEWARACRLHAKKDGRPDRKDHSRQRSQKA